MQRWLTFARSGSRAVGEADEVSPPTTEYPRNVDRSRPSENRPPVPRHTSEESRSAPARGPAADDPPLYDMPSAEPIRGTPPPIRGVIAHTEPSADTWESTPGEICTPTPNAGTLKRRSSEPSFSLNFERFTGGRLFAIPATVLLWESPGRAGRLPRVATSCRGIDLPYRGLEL